MGPLKPITIVWPSLALAAASTPSRPPAPGLLSTTTAWPQRAASLSDMARTMRSSELPGPVGTTMRTVRVGHALCALASCAAVMKPAAVAAAVAAVRK